LNVSTDYYCHPFSDWRLLNLGKCGQW
jgi:hypothetical protein